MIADIDETVKRNLRFLAPLLLGSLGTGQLGGYAVTGGFAVTDLVFGWLRGD